MFVPLIHYGKYEKILDLIHVSQWHSTNYSILSKCRTVHGHKGLVAA